jgi:CDP-diacylglycerol--glycerol-3-phosphate 3-phosphatidyltransferase
MAGRLINLPNILSSLRICVLPLLAFLILKQEGIAACAVLIFAGLSDFFDGYLARQMKQETAIGKLLDPVADKILLCVAVVFLVHERLPTFGPTLATLLLAREFLITGLRAMAAAEGLVIAAGQAGKIKTFFQFLGLGFLLVALEEKNFYFAEIGAGLLWFSVVISYYSMVQYIIQTYHELKNKLLS